VRSRRPICLALEVISGSRKGEGSAQYRRYLPYTPIAAAAPLRMRNGPPWRPRSPLSMFHDTQTESDSPAMPVQGRHAAGGPRSTNGTPTLAAQQAGQQTLGRGPFIGCRRSYNPGLRTAQLAQPAAARPGHPHITSRIGRQALPGRARALRGPTTKARCCRPERSPHEQAQLPDSSSAKVPEAEATSLTVVKMGMAWAPCPGGKLLQHGAWLSPPTRVTKGTAPSAPSALEDGADLGGALVLLPELLPAAQNGRSAPGQWQSSIQPILRRRGP